MSEEITSPRKYKKNVYKEQKVETPSGQVFKIKRLSPMNFVKEGMDDLPNPYLEFVEEGSVEKFKEAVEDDESRKFLEKFLKVCIEKGIVEPKVETEYDKEKEDEVLFWGDITQEDQSFLISSIVEGGTKNL